MVLFFIEILIADGIWFNYILLFNQDFHTIYISDVVRLLFHKIQKFVVSRHFFRLWWNRTGALDYVGDSARAQSVQPGDSLFTPIAGPVTAAADQSPRP